MEEQKLKFKGGRPITDKPKSKITNTRFTEEEYKIIEQKAERLNCTIAEYMRQSALDVKILEKKPPKEILDLQYEVRKIGVNVNQIVRKMNQNVYSNDFFFKKQIDDIRNVLGDILMKL